MNTEKDSEELLPVKIRRRTYQVVKTVAAWKGISIVDYFDDLVGRESVPDLLNMAGEIQKMHKTKPKPPEKK